MCSWRCWLVQHITNELFEKVRIFYTEPREFFSISNSPAYASFHAHSPLGFAVHLLPVEAQSPPASAESKNLMKIDGFETGIFL